MVCAAPDPSTIDIDNIQWCQESVKGSGYLKNQVVKCGRLLDADGDCPHAGRHI